jgi:hypothetical protein
MLRRTITGTCVRLKAAKGRGKPAHLKVQWLCKATTQFTTTTQEQFFKVGDFFCFQNALGYSQCCTFLHGWCSTLLTIVGLDPGANPTTFKFTATTPALEHFQSRKQSFFILKTRYAISCVVFFYNAGVVTCDRRIGSWISNCNTSLVERLSK